MSELPEESLGRLLAGQGWTVAVVETTCGGLICARIVGVAGSSAYFDRGIVAYSRESKTALPGFDAGLLDVEGAVSEPVAAALAEGVKRLSGTTFGLAETGIAGPVRGRSPKPVGSACLALTGEGHTWCESNRFEGDREGVRNQIADGALRLAVDALMTLSA